MRRDAGQLNTTFGLSYFTGRTADQEANFVLDAKGVNGVSVVNKTPWAYTEHVMGADVSVDIDATRIRAETTVRRIVYEPGKRNPLDPLFAPGSLAPDAWQESAYLLVANQLPWGGIEPYLYGEFEEQPIVIGDLIVSASVGVNVHFNSAVQLKAQATRSFFMDALFESPYDPSINNVSSVYSRLVMAF
jgi:hypothetical protein